LTKICLSLLYINIKIDPNILDVNAHSTEKEILFLYNEHIISEITNFIEVKLAAANHLINQF